MKRIKNIKELPIGTPIVNINDGIVYYYELLMVHPHNDQYVLLLDNLTQNAIKFYIPKVEENANWQIEYTGRDLLNYQYNYYMDMADRKLARMKEMEG